MGILENNNILKIEKLKKYFYTRQGIVKAVNGISLTVQEGETLGLVGESGSGKSTVGYTVMGMYKPTEGKILYCGKNIGTRALYRPMALKKEIQIVFQDPGGSLNPRRNIMQIIEVPLRVHGLVDKRRDLYIQVEELLKMVELPVSYMFKYPNMIGGGEKQMVGIARALATNPSLVVLDEPTSALDVSIQAKIINMLIRLQKQLKLSYLFITHDLSLMRNIADRVAIMYLGKICEIAPTSEFFKNPLHPYTQMLLSSISVISDEEEELKPKKIRSSGEIPSPVNIPPGCSFHLRCPWKKEICVQEDPKSLEIEKDHFVSCHIYKK